MKILPKAVKLFIITALACGDSPTKVAAAVKAEFGIVLSRQCVEAHHPERAAGARLDAKWREVFYGTRRKFLAELDNIGLAHRPVRLRQLERMLERAEEMGNLALAAQILEQAAREVGSSL